MREFITACNRISVSRKMASSGVAQSRSGPAPLLLPWNEGGGCKLGRFLGLGELGPRDDTGGKRLGNKAPPERSSSSVLGKRSTATGSPTLPEERDPSDGEDGDWPEGEKEAAADGRGCDRLRAILAFFFRSEEDECEEEADDDDDEAWLRPIRLAGKG